MATEAVAGGTSRRRVRAFARFALVLAAVLLVPLALLLTAARLALPYFSDHPEPVRAFMERQLGHQVEFASLQAGIGGLRPRLHMRALRITDDDGNAFTLDQISLDLAPLRSLRARSLRFAGIDLAGVTLRLERDADGVWQFAGFGGAGTSDSGAISSQVLDWLRAQPGLSITDSVIRVRDLAEAGRDLRLEPVEVHLRRDGDGHLAHVRAGLNGAASGDLRMWARLPQQRWQLPDVLDGRLLVELDQVRLPRWPVLGRSYEGGLSGWFGGRFVAGHVQQVGVDLVGSGVLRDQARTFETGEFKVVGRWQRESGGWRAGVEQLAFGDAGARTELAGLRVAAWDEPGVVHLAAERGQIRGLPPLWALASPAGGAYAELIAGLAPQAAFTGLAAHYQWRGAGQGQYALRVRVQDYAQQASGPWPQITGLAADVVADERRGRLRLRGEQLRVRAQRWFEAPLVLEQPAGALAWQREDATWQLEAALPRVQAEHLSGRARARLRFGGGMPLWMAALAEVDQAMAPELLHWLPTGRLSPHFSSWYRKAVREGTVTEGRLAIVGSGHPADPHGRFYVDAAFSDAEVAYVPGDDWPPLREASGQLRIEGPRLEVEVGQARLLDNKLHGGHVHIPALHAPRKQAVIAAQARGPLAPMLEFVRTPALRKRVGDDVDQLRAAGHAALDVDATVNLTGPKDVEFDAALVLDQAQLGIPVAPELLGGLAGTLKIDNAGLHAQGLSGTIAGYPLEFDVSTRGSGGAREVRFDGGGRLSATALTEALPLRSADTLSGHAGWSGIATLSQRGFDVRAEVTLDPLGVSAPAPLGKQAGVPGRFKVDAARPRQAQYWDLQLALDEHARARLRLADHAASAGASVASRLSGRVAWNGALPDAGAGLHVNGRLATLNLDRWIDWTARHLKRGGEQRLMPEQVSLQLDQLIVAGQRIPGVAVTAQRTGARWQLAFAGQALAGAVSMRAGSVPGTSLLTADLERLHWWPAEASAEPLVRQSGRVDPTRMPELSVRIAELGFAGRVAGPLELSAEPVPRGIELTRLSLQQADNQLAASGSWLRGPGGADHTQLRARVEADDVGELFAWLGFPTITAGGKGALDTELRWPGGPQDFAPGTLSGTVRAELADGVVLDVEPGVARVFGILDPGTLQRRLTLDFSDLVGRGFAYDLFKSRIGIDSGTANVESMKIKGPAAHLSIGGQIALGDRALDLQVEAVPQMGNTLAVVSAIGSLGVGAAVFIGQKIFEDEIEELTTRHYKVSGPFDDPSILPGARQTAQNP